MERCVLHSLTSDLTDMLLRAVIEAVPGVQIVGSEGCPPAP